MLNESTVVVELGKNGIRRENHEIPFSPSSVFATRLKLGLGHNFLGNNSFVMKFLVKLVFDTLKTGTQRCK